MDEMLKTQTMRDTTKCIDDIRDQTAIGETFNETGVQRAKKKRYKLRCKNCTCDNCPLKEYHRRKREGKLNDLAGTSCKCDPKCECLDCEYLKKLRLLLCKRVCGNKDVLQTEESQETCPKSESTKSMSPISEYPKSESPKSELSKSEYSKLESPKSEYPKLESPKSEYPKSESSKLEYPKSESPKRELSKKEFRKAKFPKTASKKLRTTTKYDSAQSLISKSESPKPRYPRSVSSKAGSSKVKSPRSGSPRGESSGRRMPKEGSPSGGSLGSESSKLRTPKSRSSNTVKCNLQDAIEIPKITAYAAGVSDCGKSPDKLRNKTYDTKSPRSNLQDQNNRATIVSKTMSKICPSTCCKCETPKKDICSDLGRTKSPVSSVQRESEASKIGPSSDFNKIKSSETSLKQEPETQEKVASSEIKSPKISIQEGLKKESGVQKKITSSEIKSPKISIQGGLEKEPEVKKKITSSEIKSPKISIQGGLEKEPEVQEKVTSSGFKSPQISIQKESAISDKDESSDPNRDKTTRMGVPSDTVSSKKETNDAVDGKTSLQIQPEVPEKEKSRHSDGTISREIKTVVSEGYVESKLSETSVQKGASDTKSLETSVKDKSKTADSCIESEGYKKKKYKFQCKNCTCAVCPLKEFEKRKSEDKLDPTSIIKCNCAPVCLCQKCAYIKCIRSLLKKCEDSDKQMSKATMKPQQMDEEVNQTSKVTRAKNYESESIISDRQNMKAEAKSSSKLCQCGIKCPCESCKELKRLRFIQESKPNSTDNAYCVCQLGFKPMDFNIEDPIPKLVSSYCENQIEAAKKCQCSGKCNSSVWKSLVPCTKPTEPKTCVCADVCHCKKCKHNVYRQLCHVSNDLLQCPSNDDVKFASTHDFMCYQSFTSPNIYTQFFNQALMNNPSTTSCTCINPNECSNCQFIHSFHKYEPPRDNVLPSIDHPMCGCKSKLKKKPQQTLSDGKFEWNCQSTVMRIDTYTEVPNDVGQDHPEVSKCTQNYETCNCANCKCTKCIYKLKSFETGLDAARDHSSKRPKFMCSCGDMCNCVERCTLKRCSSTPSSFVKAEMPEANMKAEFCDWTINDPNSIDTAEVIPTPPPSMSDVSEQLYIDQITKPTETFYFSIERNYSTGIVGEKKCTCIGVCECDECDGEIPNTNNEKKLTKCTCKKSHCGECKAEKSSESIDGCNCIRVCSCTYCKYANSQQKSNENEQNLSETKTINCGCVKICCCTDCKGQNPQEKSDKKQRIGNTESKHSINFAELKQASCKCTPICSCDKDENGENPSTKIDTKQPEEDNENNDDAYKTKMFDCSCKVCCCKVCKRHDWDKKPDKKQSAEGGEIKKMKCTCLYVCYCQDCKGANPPQKIADNKSAKKIQCKCAPACCCKDCKGENPTGKPRKPDKKLSAGQNKSLQSVETPWKPDKQSAEKSQSKQNIEELDTTKKQCTCTPICSCCTDCKAESPPEKSDESQSGAENVNKQNYEIADTKQIPCTCTPICCCKDCKGENPPGKNDEKQSAEKNENKSQYDLQETKKINCICTPFCGCKDCKGENPPGKNDEKQSSEENEKESKADLQETKINCICTPTCRCEEENSPGKNDEKKSAEESKNKPKFGLPETKKIQCTCTQICCCKDCKGENPPGKKDDKQSAENAQKSNLSGTTELQCTCVKICYCKDCKGKNPPGQTDKKQSAEESKNKSKFDLPETKKIPCTCTEICCCKDCKGENPPGKYDEKKSADNTDNAQDPNISDTKKLQCTCVRVCGCKDCKGENPPGKTDDNQSAENAQKSNLLVPKKLQCAYVKICSCKDCKGENPPEKTNEKSENKVSFNLPNTESVQCTCESICCCKNCKGENQPGKINENQYAKKKVNRHNFDSLETKVQCTCTEICSCKYCIGENKPGQAEQKDADGNDPKNENKENNQKNNGKECKEENDQKNNKKEAEKNEQKSNRSSMPDDKKNSLPCNKRICCCTNVECFADDCPSKKKITDKEIPEQKLASKQKCKCTDFQCLPDDFKIKYPIHAKFQKTEASPQENPETKSPQANPCICSTAEDKVKEKKSSKKCKCTKFECLPEDFKTKFPIDDKKFDEKLKGPESTAPNNKKSKKKCNCKNFECLPDDFKNKQKPKSDEKSFASSGEVCKCNDFECLPEIKNTQSMNVRALRKRSVEDIPKKMIENKDVVNKYEIIGTSELQSPEMNTDKPKNQPQQIEEKRAIAPEKTEESETEESCECTAKYNCQICCEEKPLIAVEWTGPCSYKPQCKCDSCGNKQ